VAFRFEEVKRSVQAHDRSSDAGGESKTAQEQKRTSTNATKSFESQAMCEGVSESEGKERKVSGNRERWRTRAG